MPNWCANRIEITAPADVLSEIETWSLGGVYPYYEKAVRQSIRLFIAGVTGRLRPHAEGHYAPYPALTSHGAGGDNPVSRAYSEWLSLLQDNAWLDEACCEAIERCYVACGLAGLKWGQLTGSEQAIAGELLSQKNHDWSSDGWKPVSFAELYDGLDVVRAGQRMDLRLLIPTRMATEINGFNGGLLTGVTRSYDLYVDCYGTKWPSDNRADVRRDNGVLIIDFDTAWSPPAEEVMLALTTRWSCEVTHWFSEAGSDYCGFRVFSKGELTDADDTSLEYDDEDEDGWSDVIGPDWLIDNVPHYGG
ncbi:MAG TPA: DUF1281 domain-containing protein [Buttiauxella sp.]|jgi:hypothetical protein